MKKKISIAFVNHTFVPETYGGAEKQTIRLASSLVKNKIGAFVLAPRLKKDTPSENTEKNVLIKRFKLKHLPNLGGRYFLSFIIWSVKLIFWLLKNSEKFDLIHIIHGRLHSVPAIFAGKILNKPIIIKLGRGGKKHFDINSVSKKKIVGSFFSKYILKNVNGWIANSGIIVSNLKSYNIRDEIIYKIYNGINIKDVKINKFRNDKTFIVVGRLDEEKSCHQIIKAFSKIPENLRVKLFFLGDGEQRFFLENLCKDLKQTHRIFFKGKTENVNEELVKADFYISASESEGMSNALLESMALGIPAITSNVSGVKEIVIDNKNGFIFETNNEKMFYDKLIKAIEYSKENYLAMSRSASEHILKNFSMETISKKHIKLYEDIINKN